MTEFVPTRQTWQAIQYDGTNLAAVKTAVESAQGVVLVSASGTEVHVFENLTLPEHGDTIYAGILDTNYSPWVLYAPDPYGVPLPDGQHRVVIAGWNSTYDGPAGWEAA